ncbi:uncharacterized protein [Clytia hemisphaerica]|uniref:uncharacterized protein n=1 Tax=Clytia hemisphaerica TaxID=252671 RepID=UPI0034D4FFD4
MFPTSGQPARLYGTAKTHKFESIEDIDMENLKFRPIIAQTGTYTYGAAQVIAEYLKPLCSENSYIIRNTQDFPSILKEQETLSPNEEYVSYDVESLFTNIPVEDTITYILDEIYLRDKLPQIGKRFIVERLLLKLTTESTFIFNSKFYKQIDGCTMGGPLSVILADIYMTKIENEIVRPLNPSFYYRYVDDIITKRKKNRRDNLFKKLNSKKSKLKFTCEIDPTKFLDTTMTKQDDNSYETSVHRKETKVPTHWSSKVPKKYKRNAIRSDLSRAYRISSNFHREKEIIHEKFKKVDFPVPFINSVFKQFSDKKNNPTDPTSDNDSKDTVKISIPFCENNENASKKFLRRFHQLTDNRY